MKAERCRKGERIRVSSLDNLFYGRIGVIESTLQGQSAGSLVYVSLDEWVGGGRIISGGRRGGRAGTKINTNSTPFFPEEISPECVIEHLGSLVEDE